MSSPLLVDILAYWNLNDDGSGGVSLLDATGNGNNLTNTTGAQLGTGIIGGDVVFDGTGATYLNNNNTFSSDPSTSSNSISIWINPAGYATENNSYDGYIQASCFYGPNTIGLLLALDDSGYLRGSIAGIPFNTGAIIPLNTWSNISVVQGNGVATFYLNGSSIYTYSGSLGFWNSGQILTIGSQDNGAPYNAWPFNGGVDEVGVWSRVLSAQEITYLYNNGNGISYPFLTLYYNNAQEDGDWGNLLNWWNDAGFSSQATELPDSTTIVNLYNQVIQNTQGANQCFCRDASFWSADFGVGLTLQSTGVVNMQGSSVMAGATTDGVSMHDSSTLTDTSSVAGDVTMRDSSRAYGYIGGNAYVYYDQGNGQFPIGGTVDGSVSYLDWPAVTPQWFNDNPSFGGAGNGDFSNTSNWWTDNTFTTRPINSVGTQALPDASTDVFIADYKAIYANTGTANPTINSLTATNAELVGITITISNGATFSGDDWGIYQAVVYGNVTFNSGSYNSEGIIHGTATYTSNAGLVYAWGDNSLVNLNNTPMAYGSTGFAVNISGGGNKGFLSSLLGFPWYIRF